MSDIINPTAITRGREAAYRLQSMVKDYRAQGYLVLECRVSKRTADDIRANLENICEGFDGVLPPTILGVPFFEGGDRDFEMKIKKVDQAGNELGPVKVVES